jgi:hypothetical protein
MDHQSAQPARNDVPGGILDRYTRRHTDSSLVRQNVSGYLALVGANLSQ